MLHTQKFGDALKSRGFDFFSGVPCSFLKSLINYALNECEFVMAANEGDAVAVCAGAQTAGRKTVVLMQNSGLGNAVSPLTSLNAVFRIPVLGFVSLRGEPGVHDEPQHELMGVITDTLLTDMNISWAYLSSDDDEAVRQLAQAESVLNEGRPFFFIVKKGTLSDVALSGKHTPVKNEALPDRMSLLSAVKNAAGPDTILAATTGFTGRELYTLGDDDRNLYMVGSLGCLSSYALGLNLAAPERGVIALDGDGSLLMRTGSMAVNAACKPGKLLHILFDNNAHESTGGHHTVSGGVDWPLAARAFGYPEVVPVTTVESLQQAVALWEKQGGLVFVYARIRTGAPDKLGRPEIKPHEVYRRLSSFIKEQG